MSINEIQRELERVLDAATELGSPNRILAVGLREWVLEYLECYEDEIQRFPELVDAPHWNLWMADSDLNRDALYVVAIFRGTGLEVCCGRGESYSIRSFCEHEAPDKTDKLAAAIMKRFPAHAKTFMIPHQLAEEWLGRSFPPTRR